MRNELKRLGNKQRHSFIGQFERVGYKNSYRTLLLKNVKLADTGQLITINAISQPINMATSYRTRLKLSLLNNLKVNASRKCRYYRLYYGKEQRLLYHTIGHMIHGMLAAIILG